MCVSAHLKGTKLGNVISHIRLVTRKDKFRKGNVVATIAWGLNIILGGGSHKQDIRNEAEFVSLSLTLQLGNSILSSRSLDQCISSALDDVIEISKALNRIP